MANPSPTRRPQGIEARHSRSCASRTGAECNCRPTYQASVWSARENKRVRRTFPTLAAARAWRADAQTQIRRGTMRAPTATTVREAAEVWLAGAREGSIRNRSGDRYKPSVIRGYEAALTARILPEFGPQKLSSIGRPHVQDLVDRWLAEDLNPSTVRNALMPLRVILRRAVARGEIALNPCTGVEMPAVRGKRDRFASPEEAAQLLAALPESDRGIWATAMYAGLRAGELLALDWSCVDLDAGLIRVERAYDPKAREFIPPKSSAGTRRVPIATTLRVILIEHRLATRARGLVFGEDELTPLRDQRLRRRARKTWEAAGLDRIALHECRHTYASLMIAAGVNAKALSTYMGHSNIHITFDRYGHLMPGNEDEAAGLLDAYLERATTEGRLGKVQS